MNTTSQSLLLLPSAFPPLRPLQNSWPLLTYHPYVCIYSVHVYACMSIQHWVHLGLLICTCIQGWPLGIGHSIQELASEENWFSFCQDIGHLGVGPCGMSPTRTGMSSMLSWSLVSGILAAGTWFSDPDSLLCGSLSFRGVCYIADLSVRVGHPSWTLALCMFTYCGSL